MLQSLSYVAAAIGVCVAAVYYVMILRANQRSVKATLDTRQAQILMSLYQKWIEPEFQAAWLDIMEWEWKDYDEFLAKYGRATNPDENKKLNMIGSYFEGLGVLVKRGLIDATLVDDMMSMYIVAFWQKTGSVFLDWRKRMNTPTLMEYTEYLYKVIYDIWKKQHPETLKPWAA